MRFLVNAHFPQFQANHPEWNAIVIHKGHIQAIGNQKEIEPTFKTQGQVEDMGENYLLPAICDSHLHLLEYANFLSRVNCETSTREECLYRIRQRTETASPGSWVLGHGWNHNLWVEGFGDAALLDEISEQHPIYLSAKSLHAGWVNHAALQAASIQADTPDPKGGKILRDKSGNPNGILLEAAMQLMERVIPPPSHAEITSRLLRAVQDLNHFGITSVHDFDCWELFEILQELDRDGKLPLRVVKGIPLNSLDQVIGLDLHSGQQNGNLQIGWLKLFSDGALGTQSAAMLQPYESDPANFGMLLMEKEEMVEIGRKAVKNGIHLAVHAIGDRANREVLDAFRSIRKIETHLGLPHPHHRMEHVQIIQPADQAKLSEMNILASMQPVHVLSDQETAEQQWGTRCQYAYAWNSLLKEGVNLLFGSDAPVESPNPFHGLAAAISRRKLDLHPSATGWQTQECLSFENAFQAYTINPAYATGCSERLGKIAPGYEADLMVLNQDPFTLPVDELAQLLPLRVMHHGDWVWKADAGGMANNGML